jgi:hypothetical protein
MILAFFLPPQTPSQEVSPHLQPVAAEMVTKKKEEYEDAGIPRPPCSLNARPRNSATWRRSGQR